MNKTNIDQRNHFFVKSFGGDFFRLTFERTISKNAPLGHRFQHQNRPLKKAKIRTSTIIRTETNRARALAEDDAARKAQDDFGKKYKKKWVAKVDARTCPNCLRNNDKEISMDQEFKSTTGNVVLPPMHPNCRCRINYVEADK